MDQRKKILIYFCGVEMSAPIVLFDDKIKEIIEKDKQVQLGKPLPPPLKEFHFSNSDYRFDLIFRNIEDGLKITLVNLKALDDTVIGTFFYKFVRFTVVSQPQLFEYNTELYPYQKLPPALTEENIKEVARSIVGFGGRPWKVTVTIDQAKSTQTNKPHHPKGRNRSLTSDITLMLDTENSESEEFDSWSIPIGVYDMLVPQFWVKTEQGIQITSDGKSEICDKTDTIDVSEK